MYLSFNCHNTIRKLLALIVTGTLFCTHTYAETTIIDTHENTPINVTFINPTNVGDPFWDKVTSLMQQVAADLQINLNVKHSSSNRFSYNQQLTQALNEAHLPDYLIYIYHRNSGAEILRIAEKKGVDSIIINSEIPPADLDSVGAPGRTFKHWQGLFTTNDRDGGYALAKHLHACSQELLTENTPTTNIAAISGGHDSTSAGNKNAGLKDFVAESDNTTLSQLVHTDWSPKHAQNLARMMVKRYPTLNSLWFANAEMTLATLDFNQSFSQKSGRTLCIGGFDFVADAIKELHSGRIDALSGGAFMDGARALMHIRRLRDNQPTSTTFVAPSKLLTTSNVDMYARALDRDSWEAINFQDMLDQFGEQPDYGLSLDSLKALSEQIPPSEAKPTLN